MMQVDDRYTAAAWIADGYAVEFIAETLGPTMSTASFLAESPQNPGLKRHGSANLQVVWTVGPRRFRRRLPVLRRTDEGRWLRKTTAPGGENRGGGQTCGDGSAQGDSWKTGEFRGR